MTRKFPPCPSLHFTLMVTQQLVVNTPGKEITLRQHLMERRGEKQPENFPFFRGYASDGMLLTRGESLLTLNKRGDDAEMKAILISKWRWRSLLFYLNVVGNCGTVEYGQSREIRIEIDHQHLTIWALCRLVSLVNEIYLLAISGSFSSLYWAIKRFRLSICILKL